MCGFLVQFSKENKNFQNFELANDLLEHRGPDSTKYIESKENFKFGYLILDWAAPSITISGALSPPIASNDKWIDFNKITPTKILNRLQTLKINY